MPKIPGMIEAWYPIAEGNQNENDLAQNITPFGVVTGRLFNPPMFHAEFLIKQEIKNKPKAEETIIRLSPTESRLKAENNIDDSQANLAVHVINDAIRSVGLFQGMQTIVPIQDRNIELKIFRSQFASKIKIDGIEFTDEEITINAVVTVSKTSAIEIFNTLDEKVESFSLVAYELSA